MAYNQVTLVGNLTRDPELKYLPGGDAVANISIACNQKWTKDGEAKERVDYFDIVAYKGLAETIAQHLKKGRKVLVAGSLRQDRWEEEGGKKRQAVKVVARQVQFLDGPKSNGQPQEAADAVAAGASADNNVPF